MVPAPIQYKEMRFIYRCAGGSGRKAFFPAKGKRNVVGTDPVLSDPLKRQGQIPPLCLVCHLLPVPDGGSGARDVLGTLLRAWRLMMVRFNNHCNCTFSAADEIVVQESWWKE